MNGSIYATASRSPIISSSEPTPLSIPLPGMTDQPGPSRLHWQVLFDAALQHYETQTGIALANHPLAEQLQNCHSVESITAVLREQTQAFSEFRGRDKILKPLKNVISVLHALSATADLGQAIGLVRLQALIPRLPF
jgi:hypothetical protein